MKKYLLSICLLLTVNVVLAQQKKSIVRLIRSDRSEGFKRAGKDVLKVYKGTFQQDYSTLSSDSAYFYPQDNAFDAFGNVHITQGDTLNVYSDKLNYNGNTKTAILTNNVRMIDRDAILTTDYLTYNTATRIGTYNGGGKLINKENTLTSKNGYYFANSRDAYFRYDVILNTPDALIKTDTLRYNTGSRISYFYGPSNIYGKEKDKDTLYTENGLYNTTTKQAFFGKKNLYKQGTKSLKGDSLFYDRLNGYGRAVKNITFNDREQKVTLKGDLGTYFKKDERAVVTQNAYVVLVTEENDSTDTEDKINISPIKKDQQKPIDSTEVKNQANKLLTKADSILKDSSALNQVQKLNHNTLNKVLAKPDSVKNRATNKAVIKPPTLNAKSSTPKKTTESVAKKTAIPSNKTVYIINEKGQRVKIDSVYMSADTLETQILTYKQLKALKEKMRLANVRDTATRVKKKEPIVYKTSPKYLEVKPPKWVWDSTYLHRDFFGKPQPKKIDSVVAKKDSTLKTGKTIKTDTLSKLGISGKVDSVYLKTKVKLSDTSRVRIIFAYHDAKIFKSDLQAKADSIFYSNSDSTIRCYYKPMMWTQNSQLSGDTIDLQMKNKKMDNMDIYYNSFIVNVDKSDSLHFNQVGGKKMRGFFKKNKLELMYVDGNAESIYYSRDSTTNKIDGMQRSLSSRMRIRFKNNKTTNLAFLSKPDIRYGPVEKFTEDDRLLKGFLWKPKERPVSKEAIIYSARRKAANRIAAKAEADDIAMKKRKADSSAAVKDTTKKQQSNTGASMQTPRKKTVVTNDTKPAATDSVINVVPTNPDVNRNRIQDGTLNTAPVILPATIPAKDTSDVRVPAESPPK